MIKLFFYSSFFKCLLIIFPISLLIIFFYLLYLDKKNLDIKKNDNNLDSSKVSDSNDPLNIVLCSIILIFCALTLLILLFLNSLS